LLLVPRDNSLLKQILNEPRHPAYLATTEMLTRSTRGGVMRLVLSFLDDPHAPSSSITLLAYRTDHKFLEYLLKKIGYEPTSVVAANLKRIETVAWLGHPPQNSLSRPRMAALAWQSRRPPRCGQAAPRISRDRSQRALATSDR
jgi:hypothetical protein